MARLLRFPNWVVLCGLLIVFLPFFGCPPGNSMDGDMEGMGEGNPVSGEYDPATGLMLDAGAVMLDVPPGALDAARTITVRELPVSGLAPVPGGLELAGARFEPDGLMFTVSATVSVALVSETVATALPVLTYDATGNRWVGTGDVAEVDGTAAVFDATHFSILGIPEPVPIPDEGDPIGTIVVLSNNGSLQTDVISSDSAALLFSRVGDTFNVAAMSQEVNNEGQVETKALGLDAILVTEVGNYIVGVVGGGASIYNDGQVNEPAVGVMIMSVSGGEVTLSLYVATPERVIQGTLTGTS